MRLLALQDFACPHAFFGLRTVSVVRALCTYGAGEANDLTVVKWLTLVWKPRVLHFWVVGASGGDATNGGFAETGGVLLPGLVSDEELGEELAGLGLALDCV
jgi:hypothetical protein